MRLMVTSGITTFIAMMIAYAIAQEGLPDHGVGILGGLYWWLGGCVALVAKSLDD